MRPLSDSFTDYNLIAESNYSRAAYSNRSASLDRNSISPSVYPSALPSHQVLSRQNSEPVFFRPRENRPKAAMTLAQNNAVVKQVIDVI